MKLFKTTNNIDKLEFTKLYKVTLEKKLLFRRFSFLKENFGKNEA